MLQMRQVRAAARPSAQEFDTPTKIEVRNLNFFYGDKQALFGNELAIRERQITALIGPSGCGKSTFLRCINRMNDTIDGTRMEGDILLDGYNILQPDTDVVELRRVVGMVFQRPNPFPRSIFDNITFAPGILGMRFRPAELVEQALRSAALWDEVKDKLRQSALALSGGQQQRLCIARALAVQPEVLLLDEPTAALDPISTSQIEELLMELKRNYTIVIVTHNMQQAARISDRTAFFLMGKLIEEQPTNHLFTNPRDPQTEEYITGRYG